MQIAGCIHQLNPYVHPCVSCSSLTFSFLSALFLHPARHTVQVAFTSKLVQANELRAFRARPYISTIFYVPSISYNFPVNDNFFFLFLSTIFTLMFLCFQVFIPLNIFKTLLLHTLHSITSIIYCSYPFDVSLHWFNQPFLHASFHFISEKIQLAAGSLIVILIFGNFREWAWNVNSFNRIASLCRHTSDHNLAKKEKSMHACMHDINSH